jgi:hypothetical protein
MNQSRMDSLMESIVNIVIGLIISTIANYLLLQLFLGYPMHLGTNVLISVVFTVISLVRSYSLRRAFNGRSVWSAIKDKYRDRFLRDGSCQVEPNSLIRSARSPLVRICADLPPRHRKRSYHFWGYREQTAR